MTARPRMEPLELTERHIEVLACIAQGLDHPQIAKRLGITIDTSRTHRRHVLERLPASNDAHAVALAIATGLLPHDIATRTGDTHVR